MTRAGAISSSRAAAASRRSASGYWSRTEASFSGLTGSALPTVFPVADDEVVPDVEVRVDGRLGGAAAPFTKSIPQDPCSAKASGETSPWRFGTT